jgi:hypothetical protein
MKKNVLCNFLEWVDYNLVEFDEDNEMVNLDELNWNRVYSKSAIQYNSDIEDTEAGAILKESVVISANSADVEDLDNRKSKYVLRLQHSDGVIVMGSYDYPALKLFSSNGSIVNLSFSAISVK